MEADALDEEILLDGRWRLAKSLSRCPGNIFEAADVRPDAGQASTDVVVKVLATAWIPSALLEEKRVGALVAHPVFVRVLEVGTDAKLERAFAIMERVDGDCLSNLLEKGPADTLEALTIARELLSALAAAHGKNVILGRVSPADIVVGHDASGLRVRLFATFSERDPRGSSSRDSLDPYMPPEHMGALRHAKTVESDLYAVGALLHHMLAGEPPFEGRDPHALAAAIRDSKPGPIRSELGVPRSVQQAIWRALEKQPENRFRSARDFLDALAPATTG